MQILEAGLSTSEAEEFYCVRIKPSTALQEVPTMRRGVSTDEFQGVRWHGGLCRLGVQSRLPQTWRSSDFVGRNNSIISDLLAAAMFFSGVTIKQCLRV